MSYYVYRFKDIHEQIIYVGKTKNLKSRMSQHFSKSGHLSEEVYDKVVRVEYIEVFSKVEMDIKELYYIDKWKPTHNTIHVHEDEVSNVSMEEDIDWLIHFDKSDRGEILASKLRELENERQEFIREKDKFGDTVVFLNNQIESQKVVSSIHKNTSEHYLKRIKELEEMLKEKIDTNAIIASIKSVEESKNYFDFEEALLLVEHAPNYEFMVSFTGRVEKKYHIFNNGEGYSILEIHSGKEHNSKHRLNILFIESQLREMDKTVLISGQSETQVKKDIDYATKVKEHKKLLCEKHVSFLERGSISYSIRDEFMGLFHQKFGGYIQCHWCESLGHYHTLYKACLYIEEHSIKTHKQMLELMKKDLEALSEAS